jgi:dienelactone hydrolase
MTIELTDSTTDSTTELADDERPVPIATFKPVTIPTTGRGTDLQVRVSAPADGDRLPVVVFSHGFGQSGDAYGPLVDAWVRAGFVVVQPTHLDSRSLGLDPGDPRTPTIWRSRVDDLHAVIGHLMLVEAAVPGLHERLDHDRVAIAGHSWGAQSASMLLGARLLDADGEPGEDLTNRTVSAGVLLAVPGLGADLTPFAREHFPFMHPSFETMTTPSLVVAGDHDQSPLTERGPDWFTDAHRHSPRSTVLLAVTGGEHSLGGVAGEGLAENTDENPARLALVQRVTTAFLRNAFGEHDDAWATVRTELAPGRDASGSVTP